MLALPGIFKVCDTHGLPLETVIELLNDRGHVVAWDEFVADAREHGWKDTTIRKKILGGVNEVFGPTYRKEVSDRLDLLL